MEIKTAIGNKGFLLYKNYRCLYKYISNSVKNILKWFAAFERVVSLQSNFHIICHDVKNCQYVPFPKYAPIYTINSSNTHALTEVIEYIFWSTI